MFEFNAEKRGNNVLVFMSTPIVDHVKKKTIANVVAKPVRFELIESDRIPRETSSLNAVMTLNVEDARKLARSILAATGVEK